MELAKITSKGQVTLPMSIRKTLGVKDGDNVAFIEKDNQVIIVNASLEALLRAQQAFAGSAELLGISSENDVVHMVKEIRKVRTKDI